MMTILCFDNHREDGLVWSVRRGGQWFNFSTVTVTVPTKTVYRGAEAQQPKAYLQIDEPVAIIQSGSSAWIVPA